MEDCDEALIYRRYDAEDGKTRWFAKLNFKEEVRGHSVAYSDTIELKAGLKRRAKTLLEAAVSEAQKGGSPC